MHWSLEAWAAFLARLRPQTSEHVGVAPPPLVTVLALPRFFAGRTVLTGENLTHLSRNQAVKPARPAQRSRRASAGDFHPVEVQRANSDELTHPTKAGDRRDKCFAQVLCHEPLDIHSPVSSAFLTVVAAE